MTKVSLKARAQWVVAMSLARCVFDNDKTSDLAETFLYGVEPIEKMSRQALRKEMEEQLGDLLPRGRKQTFLELIELMEKYTQ